jgi:hypothetical protein
VRIGIDSRLQARGIENLFSEIIAENFPYQGKDIDIQEQEAFRTPNRHDQKRISCCYALVKTQEYRTKK